MAPHFGSIARGEAMFACSGPLLTFMPFGNLCVYIYYTLAPDSDLNASESSQPFWSTPQSAPPHLSYNTPDFDFAALS